MIHDFSIFQATLALSPAGADVHPKGSNSTSAVAFKSAENVEDQLRHVTQIKRIRVSEFFKDFDPLRSGYITSKAPKIHHVVHFLVPRMHRISLVPNIFFLHVKLNNWEWPVEEAS